jgi:hypothetical protein
MKHKHKKKIRRLARSETRRMLRKLTRIMLWRKTHQEMRNALREATDT